MLDRVDENTYAATLPDHKVQQLFGLARILENAGHLDEACLSISGYSSPQSLMQAALGINTLPDRAKLQLMTFIVEQVTTHDLIEESAQD